MEASGFITHIGFREAIVQLGYTPKGNEQYYALLEGVFAKEVQERAKFTEQLRDGVEVAAIQLMGNNKFFYPGINSTYKDGLFTFGAVVWNNCQVLQRRDDNGYLHLLLIPEAGIETYFFAYE